MRHIHDRFLAAVKLCIGADTIKQRLLDAWLEQLDSISAGEMPETLQKDFRNLRSAMYAAKPLPREPAPVASVRKMSAQQAAVHADTILRLTGELQRICYQAESALNGDNQELIFNARAQIPDRLN